MSFSAARVFIGLAWGFLVFVLFVRAGTYPAAMTGDEIWFADSAWTFLQSGTLARPLHPDAVGSAVADFLPPLITLLQAACFAVFGLSQTAIGMPGAIMVVLVALISWSVARAAGVGPTLAAFISLAVLGSQVVLRASLYTRYEGLVTIFLLLYLWAAFGQEHAGLPGARALLRGFALALAGLSYYPTAPFIALAVLPTELWLLGRRNRRTVAAAIGFALPALAFAARVAQQPEIFRAQILGNGGGNYLQFDLIHRLAESALWISNRDVLPDFALIALVLVLGIVGFSRLEGTGRLLLLGLPALIMPVLIFPFQPRLLAMAVPPVLILTALSAGTGYSILKWPSRLVLTVWVAAALGGFGLIFLTAESQRVGRSYDSVTSGLDALLTEPGTAGIDQRAWLALRKTQPDRPLVQVFAGWAPPQVRVFEPSILRDDEGAPPLRYLVLTRSDAAGAIEASPVLKRDFAAGRYVEIGRVAPPFTPLPWARSAPYDLIVYERRGPLPSSESKAP